MIDFVLRCGSGVRFRTPSSRTLRFVSVVSVLGTGVASCATVGRDSLNAEGQTMARPADSRASQQAAVATLAEASAVRDNRSAPILAVMTVGEVVYPYVYGYPLHPDGAAAGGLAQLRRDNRAGARQSLVTDADGVVHAIEELPALGCRLEGVIEDVQKYVPVSLSCELPAPKTLGGNKRPVLGGLDVQAKAEEFPKDPTVAENFLGAFHLTSDDAATGTSTGYFNTTHGQLAFVFTQKKLTRFMYYFDPDVQAWQNPAYWARP